ncbi:hypothetical protein LOS20_10235 [Enterococcus faecium]|nr:hypothetical protein [Enterococcus faecium]
MERDQPRKTKLVYTVLRIGSLPGEHDVLFASTDEILSIKHESFSNQNFCCRRSKCSFLVERSVTRWITN